MPGFIVYIKRHLLSAPFYESHSHRRSCLSASERTQPSIPTAQARILGQQADPQTLAEPNAQIKSPCKTSASTAVRRLAPMGRAVSEDCQAASATLLHPVNPLPFITRFARLIPLPRAARCRSPLGCLLIAHEVWRL